MDELNWVVSQSNQRPPELDTTSSAYVVYFRRNIKEETIQGEMGENIPMFTYEEATMDKAKYQTMMIDKLKAENADLRTQLDENTDALIELAALIG